MPALLKTVRLERENMPSRWAIVGCFILGLAVGSSAAEKRGGLCLQFDDGWSAWKDVTAPELSRVGGKATGFVNNQFIQSGRITVEDLLVLQNQYGWEIGSHLWRHVSAPAQVRQQGLAGWRDDQLARSLIELRGAGLTVQSLVFPFNEFTPEIANAVTGMVRCFRRTVPFTLTSGPGPDGSLPATLMEPPRYVPVARLKQWIDAAYEQDQVLCLYAHRILPDDRFVTGTVASLTGRVLIASAPVTLTEAGEEALMLVPDVSRGGGVAVVDVDGTSITLAADAGPIRPGATFLLGPSFAYPLGEFRDMLTYAAERVAFYTVQEVADGQHRLPSQNRPLMPAR